jgi:uncharacterized phage-associated protein
LKNHDISGLRDSGAEPLRGYTANVQKAVEVILWFAAQSQTIDVYHVVKGAFFADKFHIQNFGRPVIGDQYRAVTWGPLPQVIYGIIRRQPIEMQALQSNGYLPFRLENEYNIRADREPNIDLLSASDQKALRHGWNEVRDKSFHELIELTHADPAYVKASGGVMDYRNFLDPDDPERETKARYLEEVAPYAVF